MYKSLKLQRLTYKSLLTVQNVTTKFSFNQRIGKVRHSSASFLFVPRNDGELKVPAILKPQIEHLFQSENAQSLENNLKVRKIKNVDLDLLNSQWKDINSLKSQLRAIDSKKTTIQQLISQKIAEGLKKDDLEKDLNQVRNLKLEYKTLSKDLIKLEELLVPAILQLPNSLHPGEELSDNIIQLTSEINQPLFDFPPKSHVEIGSSYLMFPENNAGAYYFFDRLAALELATLDYFADHYRIRGFTKISNPDICKAIVVEGCGYDIHDSTSTFQLEIERDAKSKISTLHLTGSASLPTFCAKYAKHALQSNRLPLKYISTGRNYRPVLSKTEPSLFNCQQSSQLQFFIPYQSEESIFDETLEILRKSFDGLNLHYRIVRIGPGQLLRSECRRRDLQMWSPFTQTYHTVASISDYGDYLAKRLWMLRKDEHEYGFVNVIGGVGIDVPPFLACLMENHQLKNGDFNIHPTLQSFVTKFINLKHVDNDKQ